MIQAQRAVVTPASTSFILITLIFCIVLVIVHVFLLFADGAWSTALSLAINAAEISPATYSYREPGSQIETLLLCHQVPAFAGDTFVANPCNISIPISTSGDTGFVQHFPEIVRYPPLSRLLSPDGDHQSWQRWAAGRPSGLNFQPTFADDGSVSELTASSSLEQSRVSLSLQCVQSLIYPRERCACSDSVAFINSSLPSILKDNREDIALIVFQLWLFSVSIFAILYESVPHMYVVLYESFPIDKLTIGYRWVSLLSRVLVTGWSVFALVRTVLNLGLYATLYRSTVSPCNIDIFDNYLSFRLGWIVCRSSLSRDDPSLPSIRSQN